MRINNLIWALLTFTAFSIGAACYSHWKEAKNLSNTVLNLPYTIHYLGERATREIR